MTIIANKGIIESVSSESTSALDGLVGKKFDGGVITDHIAASGKERLSDANETVGSWIEGVLGRTEWGRKGC